MKFPFTTTLILIFHCYLSSCSSNSNYPEDQTTTTTTIPYVTTVTESILDITFDTETETTFISSNTIIKALHDGILSTLNGKLANDPAFHTRCLNIPILPHSYRESLSNYRHLILTALSLSYPKHKSFQRNISTCESSKRSAYKTAYNHVNSLKSQIRSLRNDIQHYSPSNTCYWPLKLQIEFDIKQRALEDYEAELVDYLDRAQSIKRFNCRNWAKGGEGVMTSVYRKMSALSTLYEDLLYCLMSGNKYYYNLVHDSGVVIKTHLQRIPAVFVAVYTKKFEFKELPLKVMMKSGERPCEEVVVRLMNTDVFLKNGVDDQGDVESCRKTLAFYLGKIMGCYGNIIMKRKMDMYTEEVKNIF